MSAAPAAPEDVDWAEDFLTDRCVCELGYRCGFCAVRATVIAISRQLADERKRIAEHNKRCEREHVETCGDYDGTLDCPRRYMIEGSK